MPTDLREISGLSIKSILGKINLLPETLLNTKLNKVTQLPNTLLKATLGKDSLLPNILLKTILGKDSLLPNILLKATLGKDSLLPNTSLLVHFISNIEKDVFATSFNSIIQYDLCAPSHIITYYATTHHGQDTYTKNINTHYSVKRCVIYKSKTFPSK